ncbi:MAG: reverse transcriptase domain-containing protein, partial [Aeromonas sp.]
GISGGTLRWVTTFLEGRTYRVRVGNSLSSSAVVKSGVPQGSVLGPLLFIIYIADLANELKSTPFLFADDVKLVNNLGRDALVEDLEVVLRWSRKWDLPLNQQKCQLLANEGKHITIEASDEQWELSSQQQVKDLGIIVSMDLKWGSQCVRAANTARGALFRLKAVLTNRSPEVFLPLYKSLVRPHLEYCVQAWSPYLKKDIDTLEGVQRLATRMIQGLAGKSYQDRLIHLDLFSLSRRRLRGDLIEAFKIVRGLSEVCSDMFVGPPRSGTRGHSLKLFKPRSRLLLRSKFFSHRVISYWNRLPEDICMSANVHTFKSHLDTVWRQIFPDFYP